MLTIGSSFAKTYIAYWKCDGVIYHAYIIAENITEAQQFAATLSLCE
ncbi:hypothetical protein TRIP_D390013 [uncultured Paludibacter sp.]|uniref:Uncharacterized protein n=1 Tax=uncultured Paludibacter sp. TaxID=497635 RepID=A0A653AE62_9BACT|nr:hypothetical protein TRIP_D390013 [uncultured Paludibacter sp.]